MFLKGGEWQTPNEGSYFDCNSFTFIISNGFLDSFEMKTETSTRCSSNCSPAEPLNFKLTNFDEIEYVEIDVSFQCCYVKLLNCLSIYFVVVGSLNRRSPNRNNESVRVTLLCRTQTHINHVYCHDIVLVMACLNISGIYQSHQLITVIYLCADIVYINYTHCRIEVDGGQRGFALHT